MAIRKDGVKSCGKIMQSALDIFAEKGYQKTTVAEICKRAGCNVAAVNYHFGSKEELYVEIFKQEFAKALELYPPDGGLPDDSAPEEKLRALVHCHVNRILDQDELGAIGQIMLREMSEPSGIIQELLDDLIKPVRERTHEIIGELLGPGASEKQKWFCDMSVVHQCFAMGFLKGKHKLPEIFEGDRMDHEMIDSLVEHITRFSLAGIVAVRAQIEAGAETVK